MLIHNGIEISASLGKSQTVNWTFTRTSSLFGNNFHLVCSQMDVLRLTGDTPLLNFKKQSNI